MLIYSNCPLKAFIYCNYYCYDFSLNILSFCSFRLISLLDSSLFPVLISPVRLGSHFFLGRSARPAPIHSIYLSFVAASTHFDLNLAANPNKTEGAERHEARNRIRWENERATDRTKHQLKENRLHFSLFIWMSRKIKRKEEAEIYINIYFFLYYFQMMKDRLHHFNFIIRNFDSSELCVNVYVGISFALRPFSFAFLSIRCLFSAIHFANKGTIVAQCLVAWIGMDAGKRKEKRKAASGERTSSIVIDLEDEALFAFVCIRSPARAQSLSSGEEEHARSFVIIKIGRANSIWGKLVESQMNHLND